MNLTHTLIAEGRFHEDPNAVDLEDLAGIIDYAHESRRYLIDTPTWELVERWLAEEAATTTRFDLEDLEDIVLWAIQRSFALESPMNHMTLGELVEGYISDRSTQEVVD